MVYDLYIYIYLYIEGYMIYIYIYNCMKEQDGTYSMVMDHQ